VEGALTLWRVVPNVASRFAHRRVTTVGRLNGRESDSAPMLARALISPFGLIKGDVDVVLRSTLSARQVRRALALASFAALASCADAPTTAQTDVNALDAPALDVRGWRPPPESQRIYVGTAGPQHATYRGRPATTMSLPTIVDWFSCASFDGGWTFSCVYTGTSWYGSDYWAAQPGEPYEFYTTSNCTYMHSSYCDQTLRSGPGRGPYGHEASNETQSDEATPRNAPPDCNNAASLEVKEKAYCDGTPVNQNPTRLARVNAALDRMEALGGTCASLASIGRQLVASGTLRIFPASAYRGFSGSSPIGGHHISPHINRWMSLSSDWTDRWYDSVHKPSYWSDRYNRTLQSLLAHELDHLNGSEHIDREKVHTPNSQACDDV